ncbi:hypothetical protein AGMMS50249_2830 [candidate division SR1 bacterium]|nr:hypothetical protein AGMMS50249_2830 [candidate division SR1 bacterium]
MIKNSRFKPIIIIAIIAIVGFGCTFAQDATPANQEINTTVQLLKFFFGILSRIWVVPAHLAGNFLTNQMVNGAVLGIDGYLWNCRNVMKNIANFLLAFLFVAYIAKNLVSKGGDIVPKVKDLLLKLLVAGIAIQASRFVTFAVVDLSTIMISAVGAMPSQFISTSNTLPDNFADILRDPEKNGEAAYNQIYRVNFADKNTSDKTNFNFRTKAQEATAEVLSKDQAVDTWMPNGDSLAGPLIYMGVSIFQSYNQHALDNTAKPTSMLLFLLMDAGGIALYALMMIFLCVVAFMRIVYLWVFIVCSPIIILLFCFQKIGKEADLSLSKELYSTLENHGLSINSILSLIFKPVVMTLAISAILIFSTLMQSVIQRGATAIIPFDRDITVKTSIVNTKNSSNDKIYNSTFDSKNLSFTLRNSAKTFGDVFLMIITMIGMFFVIKLAVTSSIGGKNNLIDKFTSKGRSAAETYLKRLPIVPLGGKGPASLDLLSKATDKIGQRLSPEYLTANLMDESEAMINAFMGTPDTKLLQSEKNTLKTALNTSITSKDYTGQIKDIEFIKATNNAKISGKYFLHDPYRQNLFVEWINSMDATQISKITDPQLKNLKQKREEQGKDNRSLTNFIKKDPTNNAILLRNIFGGGNAPKTLPEFNSRQNFK